MFVIFIIYLVGVVGVALYFDHPHEEYFGFGDRLYIMLLWPFFIIFGLILNVIANIIACCVKERS